MRKSSEKWIVELNEILTLCSDDVQRKSVEYDFFEIKGINPDVIRLAVYKLHHTDCWDIAFQQRPNVWHTCGNFPRNNAFHDMFGGDVSDGWRNDIEVLKNGFETPVEWIRSFIV